MTLFIGNDFQLGEVGLESDLTSVVGHFVRQRKRKKNSIVYWRYCWSHAPDLGQGPLLVTWPRDCQIATVIMAVAYGSGQQGVELNI